MCVTTHTPHADWISQIVVGSLLAACKCAEQHEGGPKGWELLFRMTRFRGDFVDSAWE